MAKGLRPSTRWAPLVEVMQSMRSAGSIRVFTSRNKLLLKVRKEKFFSLSSSLIDSLCRGRNTSSSSHDSRHRSLCRTQAAFTVDTSSTTGEAATTPARRLRRSICRRRLCHPICSKVQHSPDHRHRRSWWSIRGDSH